MVQGTEMVVVVPTRGRPHVVEPMVEAFRATCTARTELVFSVDLGDPDLTGYLSRISEVGGALVGWSTPMGGSMVAAMNATAAERLENDPTVYAVGFMGDDHRPRTRGWDERYLDALREPGVGIVYGDDLLQGVLLPTQCAMCASIPRALGHMCPPTLTHLYVDDYWKQLGNEAGCLRYLPDVVVEHVHPVADKAEWDAGYERVNAPGVYARDMAAFQELLSSGKLHRDAAAVKELLRG
jgi:hypothetical protein